MEIKINREIREYTESIFFGLSMRQFFFSLLAVAVALGIYFGLKPHVGAEAVSWLCIVGAFPFAALGFVKYHGMTAEEFLWVWLRSELIEPKHYYLEPNNIYYAVLRDSMVQKEKEAWKRSDQKRKNRKTRR